MTSFEVWDNEDKCISETTSSQDNSQIYHLNIGQTLLHEKKWYVFTGFDSPCTFADTPLLSNNVKPLFLGKITRHRQKDTFLFDFVF
jgi:hypothetical protein